MKRLKINKADVIYHSLSFAAAIAVLLPVEMPAFFFLTDFSVLWSLLLSVGFFFLGYGMQWLYATLGGVRRYRRPGMTGDDGMQRFSVPAAAGPIGVSLLLSVGGYFLFSYLFERRAMRESLPYYNIDSPLPYLAAAGMFAGLLLGIVLWFYPPEKLASYRVVLFSVVGAALFSLLSLLAGENAYITTCSVCFVILMVCVLLLVNQAHISQGYRGAVVCRLTSEDRLYNSRLILFMVVLILFVALLCGIAAGGFVSLVRAGMFVVLAVLLKEDESGEHRYFHEPDLPAGEFRHMVFQGSPLMEIGFYLFLIGGIVLLLFVLLRRQNIVREMLARIRRFIEDIIAFFATAKLMWTEYEPEETLNYTDERQKIQKAAVREYEEMAAQTRTYERFLEQLHTLRDTDARMGYAYMMLIRVCRQQNVPLKTSDTPREVQEKLRRAGVADLREITGVLELVKYAQLDMGQRGSETVEAICGIVKKYLS